MNKIPYSDYFEYREWIFKNYSVGFSKLYTIPPRPETTDVDQPPGTIYILRGSYELFHQTSRLLSHFLHLNAGATLWINDNLLIFFFRLPSIIADLFLGFFIYILVKSKANEKFGLIAGGLYLLNPAIIYNSTIWGQMDSINNLFFYLSLVFLLRKSTFLSLLFFACSLYIKISLVTILPLYLAIGLFGGFFQWKRFIFSIIIILILIGIANAPFFSNPLSFIEFITHASSGQSQTISVNAFNFWWLIFNPILHITYPPNITTVYYGLSLNSWGYLLFSLFYIPLFFVLWKSRKNKNSIEIKVFFLCAMAAFITFLFLPKMHERYLYPVFPLLITWIVLVKRYWISTIVLSFLHFLNLYTIWNPDLFLFRYFDGAVRSTDEIRIYCILTLLIFGFFYVKLFSEKI